PVRYNGSVAVPRIPGLPRGDWAMKSICCLLMLPLFLLVSPARGNDPKAASKTTAAAFDIRVIRDIPYFEGKDADPVKHKLDLYLPRGAKDFPVVFFVHGGAWRHGDKNYLGVYSSVAMCLARLGLGTVVTNYRLSPTVQHPEHIKDVARAFAWTCKNVGHYGGCPEEIFVC